ncbi:MAG: hypothetical protein V3R67_08940, partial [Thermodesulfobacteriota bacterium]
MNIWSTEERKILAEDTEAAEGCINHMYLDSKGFVTVGVGQLLKTVEDAKKLAFEIDGSKATELDIIIGYSEMSSQNPAKPASFYKALTCLILPDSEIYRL